MVSGPSGAGKSSLCAKLREARPDIHFSVSCTTRAPRPGEQDGRDYHFISRDEFNSWIARGDFVEHAEVHGNHYGTLRSELLGHVQAGRDVLLDIDVQGGMSVRKAADSDPLLAKCLELIFIAPPSLAELEKRLRGRGTESEEIIQRRLGNARRELAAWGDYEYLLINDDLERAAHALLGLFDTLRMAVKRMEKGEFYV